VPRRRRLHMVEEAKLLNTVVEYGQDGTFVYVKKNMLNLKQLVLKQILL
jgi:hypothetical protein